MSAAFAPYAIWWLAPIAIALHMQSIHKSSKPYLNAFIFGFLFNAISLHWTSTYVGSTPWIILAIGEGLLFVPLGFAKRLSISFYPILYLAMEELRNVLPFGGFGWLRLAYSQAEAPYREIASIGGATALSALVLCISLFVFALLHSQLKLLPILPLALIFIPLQLNVTGNIDVLMVQGDVPQLGLDFNSRAKQVFTNHLEETHRALTESANVDFILWPENAVDVDPFTNKDVAKSLDSIEYPIIVGAVIREQSQLKNVSILWSKTSVAMYVKTHLTPFGEYIPLRILASKISPLVDSVEDFTPGVSAQVFTIKKATIAPVICFEIIDDQIMHSAAQNSNLIVVQTNSATFGTSPESAQQLGISRIRAIEHGRDILSVSTTGLSAVINSNGDIIESTNLHEAAHIFATPRLISSQTPRDRLGESSKLAAFAWLLLLTRARFKRVK